MSIKQISSGGGEFTLDAPASVSNQTVTLPDATTTLVGTDATQTLSNKSFQTTPAVLTAQSMVRLNTANGHGSTNTVIRRFTNTVTNQGSDITYADSATLGASFTINTNGVYGISFSDQFNAASWVGISLNSSQLTTGIPSISVANIVAIATTHAANVPDSANAVIYLPAGSVIRAHTSGATTGTNTSACQFIITRIA